MSTEPQMTPNRRVLRWLKRFYLAVHGLLLLLILVMAGALYVAFRPDGLSLVNTYLLEPMGIRYSRAEGSLAWGFTLYDVSGKTARADKLTLSYDLAKMVQGEHVIDKIEISGLRLDLNDFISDDDSPWPFPTFRLKEIRITNLQLISTYPVELDISAKNGQYDGDNLSFQNIRATVKSRYASAAVSGSVHENALTGKALLYPNRQELASYSGRFTDLPRSISLQIRELSNTKALVRGTIPRLILKQDATVYADGLTVDLDYRYENDFLDFDALYRLWRGNDSMQTRQHLRYAFDGTTTTKFDGVIASLHPLPDHRLQGEITDNAEGVSGSLSINDARLLFSSSDYDRFRWDLAASHDNLTFLPMLPPEFQNSPFTLSARGEYRVSESFLAGSADFEHNHGRFQGNFAHREGHSSLDGNLTLSPDAPTWKEWSHKPPGRLTVSLIGENDRNVLHLTGDTFDLSLTGTDKEVSGTGNYAGAYFDLKGNLGDRQSEFWINARSSSLFATLSSFHPIALHKGEYYDGEMQSTTHLTIGEALRFHSEIKIPWYAAVLDSQRAFGGTNGSLTLDYDDGNMTVSRYRFEIADHPVYTDKPSRIHRTADGRIIIDELWIYDTLLLTGNVSPDTSASLRLHSDRFSYNGPEGEAHASADIMFTRDAEANQNLSGELTLLDAEITYLPLQQFKVMDDDIIIIQDVRPPSAIKFAMNVRIASQRPVHYKTKELDLRLTPDVTLWKEPLGPIQLLGMVTVPTGSATASGKQFDIKHSEIYFGGDIPINPYLDLTIGHEVDYKKILIYVTHTLNSPIFLFSSDPVMSQNDIMSYILFGTPANSITTGDTSTSTIRADATNFMLGAGLKGLIKGVTKVQIDTMNILTTQQGGMGFEVGARINKNLRVLYKNDTLSSVLVQYQLNRWLRLDADVHELGQGINAVYVKDFRDFLPHNERKKP